MLPPRRLRPCRGGRATILPLLGRLLARRLPGQLPAAMPPLGSLLASPLPA